MLLLNFYEYINMKKFLNIKPKDIYEKFECYIRESGFSGTLNYDNEQDRMYVDIDTIEQLQMASQYMDFDDYYNRYKGWFEYSLSDEEIQADSIIWAGNKSKKDGTRFGIKIEGDKMFRIAMNKGNTFVYLDSASPNTLESFLGQQKDEIVFMCLPQNLT